MTQITPQPGIMDIALYESGAAHVDGISNVVKLSSNENPFGPSDQAREAYAKAGYDLHRYPSSDHGALRRALAAHHGLDTDRIICGAGSDEIIAFLCQAYAGPGTEVIHTEHGFAMYKISALAAGATPVEVPERERVTDVDAILAACTDATRLVFLANPNNPTGTMIGDGEVARLAEALPPHVLLVLDGAYAEYVEGYDGGAGLVDARQNVVMTRTFSKLYGLGGLRVGWGYGPKHVIDVLNRVRGPFNLATPALAAAEAALRDTAWTEKCRNENSRLRAWLAEALAEHGVPSDTSTANFILARFASPDQARACDAHLQSQGLIVRQVAGYNLPHCLRITVGDEPSCRRVAHAIGQFMGDAE
ncbi:MULTISPECIES: histidinol-phosphate transaminase [Roseovarius]|jgi:histidinol-phosphate aminotransferase|uniref:Histidinol-phosphate aminotransferase n=3 Tax=Roseovarius nubinhibens TaxID=314263 RepID=A3SIE2_ROSNI|nr:MULTISPECIES: histidinol-phosphate transaminase [Roseovarius]EAP77123.1 histidinol-phosphate aminotransferase [Roseovarius nubinhibens ISM]MAO27578.1 histidinol-phosphate transaminase [Roseovarius sp.]MAZ22847.1 histidinol-phosphate transaminase [Roseovarius sp.]MBU2999554.1 histidinol-phosphate transaminase [Roseovarius nubinhibens]